MLIENKSILTAILNDFIERKDEVNIPICDIFVKVFDRPKNKRIIPGTFFILSNVGQFKLGGPFDDVHIRTSDKASDYFPSISFLHFAKIGENKNQLFSSFSYQPSVMTKREADLLLNSIHFGLENISLNITMAEAIDKIKDFQNDFVDNKFDGYLIK